MNIFQKSDDEVKNRFTLEKREENVMADQR